MATLVGLIEQLRQKIQEQGNKKVNEAVYKGLHKSYKHIESELHFVLLEAVQDWYEAYSPRYGRVGTLIGSAKAEGEVKAPGSIHLEWWYDTGMIHGWGAAEGYHKNWSPLSGQAVGDMALVQGMHGGAYQGSWRWRSPYPKFYEAGPVAKKTTPPIELAQKKIEKEKGKWAEYIVSSIAIEVTDALQKL